MVAALILKSFSLTLPIRLTRITCHVLLDDRGLPAGTSEPQPENCEADWGRSFDDLLMPSTATGGRTWTPVAARALFVAGLDDNCPFAQVFSPGPFSRSPASNP